jgi:inorganic triphosphatase YgiF
MVVGRSGSLLGSAVLHTLSSKAAVLWAECAGIAQQQQQQQGNNCSDTAYHQVLLSCTACRHCCIVCQGLSSAAAAAQVAAAWAQQQADLGLCLALPIQHHLLLCIMCWLVAALA